MIEENIQEQCKHGGCNCVGSNNGYCSEYCKNATGGDPEGCECGHSACASQAEDA